MRVPVAVFLSAAVALLAFCLFWCSAPKEPGGTRGDAFRALNDPDEYAWQLFFYLNRPARAGRAGKADWRKKFGDFDSEGALVWESWALASGGDKSELFRPDESDPDKWD